MISTKLYNEQSIERFKSMTGQIQQTQAKIATGKNVMKASDDPVAAANISFVKGQKVVLDRYATNIQRADKRLTLVENMLGEAANIITRAYELSIQANNDTYSHSDRKAIAKEIGQLKGALLGIANATDEKGDYLFSGYKVGVMPFVKNSEGTVEYKGDRGIHAVQVSESMKMDTGVDGAGIFLRAKAGGSATSVFKIFEIIENNLNQNTIKQPNIALNFEENGVKAEGNEVLRINLTGENFGPDDDLQFDTLPLKAGDGDEAIIAVMEAFEALDDKKGFSAKLENNIVTFVREDGTNFNLTSTESGVTGATMLSLQASVDEGVKVDLESGVATSSSNANAGIARLKGVLEHINVERTSVGAQMRKGEMQQEIIDRRLLLMTENISSIEDADLAALITELQSQIVNRDAAQQAFVKIGSQTLFDYIR